MHVTTEKQLQMLLESNPMKTKLGIGGGLFVRRMAGIQKGGIYFKANHKRKEIHLGSYGKSPGEMTLKQAREKWEYLKRWAIETGNCPSQFNKSKKEKETNQVTLKEAVDAFLKWKMTESSDWTMIGYRSLLLTDVIPVIGADTTLASLEWENNGRRKVMEAIKAIEAAKSSDRAHRCQKVMGQVFNLAMSNQWMKDSRNPADRMRGDDSPKPSRGHHPCVKWEEVPQLIHEVNLNRHNSHIQIVMATKMLLMTFLRVSSLVRLQWDWFDTEFPDTISIPGTTPGLKRKVGVSDHIPHHVPVTPQMGKLFATLKEYSGESKYVFQPTRKTRVLHLSPDTPNMYLELLGFSGRQTAHGWRKVAMTNGIDILKFDRDIIKKQMAHLPQGNVNKAYDASLHLDERRDFMNQWCELLVDAGLKV